MNIILVWEESNSSAHSVVYIFILSNSFYNFSCMHDLSISLMRIKNYIWLNNSNDLEINRKNTDSPLYIFYILKNGIYRFIRYFCLRHQSTLWSCYIRITNEYRIKNGICCTCKVLRDNNLSLWIVWDSV